MPHSVPLDAGRVGDGDEFPDFPVTEKRAGDDTTHEYQFRT